LIWILRRSSLFIHEFELEGEAGIELKLSCRKSEIMQKMRLLFGNDVQVDLAE
jgi:hypothetical protein